jgi:hypothetical protein
MGGIRRPYVRLGEARIDWLFGCTGGIPFDLGLEDHGGSPVTRALIEF